MLIAAFGSIVICTCFLLSSLISYWVDRKEEKRYRLTDKDIEEAVQREFKEKQRQFQEIKFRRAYEIVDEKKRKRKKRR